MTTIFVKHFLSDEGLKFFGQWFNQVQLIISHQPGFISIDAFKDIEVDGCVEIILKFVDRKSFDMWDDCTDHDVLINALNPFRSRPYFYFMITEETINKFPSTDEMIKRMV